MSGLNASLGYFLACVISAASVRTLLKSYSRFSFLLEFASSFMLVACCLEVQTIVEVGEWAGGLGPDVTLTILFVVLLSHGVVCGNAAGNSNVSLMKFLQMETKALPTLLAVASQFAGAHAALLAAGYYWSLELTDMHMIKNLMARECTSSLLVSLVQGFITEGVCALVFHLIHLNLRHRSVFIRIPFIALLLTFLSFTARGYTSGFVNPALAYGITFYCSGFNFAEYSLVYCLGSFTGMTAALFLYMGHIPRIFAKNLLYLSKTRFKVPKGEKKKSS